jgi:hypothetical protein
MESEDVVEPTARIAAYVRALLDRFPDIGTEAGVDSPWSVGPLMGDARGSLVVFPMVWSRSEDVSAWAAELAEDHGLNCYDPQRDQLRTPWGELWRFELTSARDHPFRDPDPDIVRSVLAHVSADHYFAVLERADGWYLQFGYGEQAGTRPGWYALERRDGAPDQHYRVEVTNVEEVIRAFLGFLEDDPTIALQLSWRPYAV